MVKSHPLLSRVKERIKDITPIQGFVVLVIIVIVVFVVKYFGLEEEWKTVRMEVRGREWSEDWTEGYPRSSAFEPPSWLARNVSVGDAEVGVDGKKIAEVLSVEEYGEYKTGLFIIANLKVIRNKRTDRYAFKNKGVEVGTKVELLLPKARVVGQIIDIDVPVNGYEKKNITVTGRAYNLEQWVVTKVTVGDRMINQANGEVVAEILDKKTEPTVSSVFFTDPRHSTNVFLETVPRRKDVVLTLRVEVTKYDEGWRFAGNQIPKVGLPIKLYYSDYNLPWVEIQDLHDEK